MERLTRTIKAISVKKKAEGEIGFLTTEEDKWYNIRAEEKILDTVLEGGTIKKGNKVEFEMKDGFAENFKIIEKAKEEKKKWEDDIVSFEVLLTAAHKKAKEDNGHLSIKTSVIRDEDGKPLINLEKKFAVFKASVEVINGDGSVSTYQGHGDATDTNVTGEFIKPHFIRMAETRAIVRALRWYTNNGCAEEEK